MSNWSFIQETVGSNIYVQYIYFFNLKKQDENDQINESSGKNNMYFIFSFKITNEKSKNLEEKKVKKSSNKKITEFFFQIMESS